MSICETIEEFKGVWINETQIWNVDRKREKKLLECNLLKVY